MSRITGLTRLGLVVLLAAMPLAGATVLPGPAAQAQDNSAVEQTREITNYGKNTKQEATVRVSRTKNLLDRQQVEIDLSGFLPSYNANNTEINGGRIEYPVVVMQCRGDNPTKNTCFHSERSQWRAGFDAAAPAEQRAVADKQEYENQENVYAGDTYAKQFANMLRAQQNPFRAANGTSYLWSVRTQPGGVPYLNEPTMKSFPPTDVTSEGSATINTRNVPIGADGTNEFLFEIRQNATQPSLGCTSARACSIVVVPIMDMACADPLPAKATGCGGPPKGPPAGELGWTNENNQFLASQQWLAESNWRNRFVVPLSFAPDLQTCDVRAGKSVIPTYGSELVSVAQERWAAAYCTGARPGANYLPGYVPGSEYFGRRRLTTKLGASYQENAAFVTQPVTESPRPIAHAPVALTGFAVAFVVDDGNGRQVQNLTLSARLLAKLITQSYNPVVVPPNERTGKRPYDGTQPVRTEEEARKYYVAHPGLFNNPRSLFADPEFEDLNPDLVMNDQSGAAAFHLLRTLNPTVFNIESDVMMDVTRYVTADPAARAWLDGQPDRYGMRVNPAWQGLQPTQLYSQLDTWVRTPRPRKPGWSEDPKVHDERLAVYGGGDTCDEMHRTPYLTKVGNIANSAKLSALSLLDRRGSATPICVASTTPVPKADQAPAPEFPGDLVDQDVIFTETKEDPKEFGKRAQLALTTVAQARLYELPVAKLVNAGGKAVAPTVGTMVNALNAAVVDETAGTIQIDHKAITGANWYPGTMVSYLAVPTSGLDRGLAGQYADYIEFMATTGQVPGQTLANLPPGYDPLTPVLVEQAKTAARMVREQRGEVPPPPGDPLGDGPASVTNLDNSAANNPGSGLPVSAQSTEDDKKVDGDPENVAKTQGASSWLARWTLPLLIGFGLLAGLVAFGVRIGSQPDHPLRRRFDELLRVVGRR